METTVEIDTPQPNKPSRFGLPQHWKTLLVLYLTVFIDVLGFGIIFPLLPFYVLEIGGDAIWLGLITSSYSLFASIGSLVWGTASDKYGRKPFLLLGLFGVCIGQVGFGFSKALYLMVIARSFAGFCGGTESVAAAFVADLSTPEQRTKYMGHLGACGGLGFVIGPGLGGLLGGWLGFQGVAFVAAGMSAVTVVLGIFLLKEPKRERSVVREKFDWRSRATILTDRKYIPLFLSGWFVMFGWLAFDIAMPITGAVKYNMTEWQLGIVFMGFGVLYTAVLLMAPIFQRKIGEKSAAMGAAFVGTLLLVGVSWIPNKWGWVPVILLMAICGGITDFCYPGLISASTPPDRQGFVFGVFRGVGSAVRAVAPLVMGILWDWDFHAPYILAGSLWAISIISLSFFKVPMGYSQVEQEPNGDQIEMELGQKFVIEEVDVSDETRMEATPEVTFAAA